MENNLDVEPEENKCLIPKEDLIFEIMQLIQRDERARKQEFYSGVYEVFKIVKDWK